MPTRPSQRGIDPDVIVENAQVDGATAREGAAAISSTRAALAAQPKVRIRLQEDTFVGINGHPFIIKAKEWVEVPQTVAEILEQGGRY